MTFLRSSARAIGAVPSSPVSHQQRPGAVPWGRSGYIPFGTKPLDLVAIYRPALLVPITLGFTIAGESPSRDPHRSPLPQGYHPCSVVRSSGLFDLCETV